MCPILSYEIRHNDDGNHIIKKDSQQGEESEWAGGGHKSLQKKS